VWQSEKETWNYYAETRWDLKLNKLSFPEITHKFDFNHLFEPQSIFGRTLFGATQCYDYSYDKKYAWNP
jgi:hypothetical protein